MSFLFEPIGPATWRPAPLTRGPFGGIQGGASAALMCAQVEALAAVEKLGAVASVTTHFLRPVPLADLSVTTSVLRRGRRISIVDAQIIAENLVVAVQRVTLITDLGSDLPTPPEHRIDPESYEPRLWPVTQGGPRMMDAMEARQGPDDIVWFRLRNALLDGHAPAAHVLPAADWAHGLGAPLGAPVRPSVAIPNVDLSLHLFLQPRGEWIGVDHATAWSAGGVGAGWAAIHDARGLIGRVAMSVAVSRL
ncbi:MAG: thioesterase family protein [Sphingopyxis sp.]|nr:thioesterase family protein [Sphingopyxis sp.]